jgi:hypothetical protein
MPSCCAAYNNKQQPNPVFLHNPYRICAAHAALVLNINTYTEHIPSIWQTCTTIPKSPVRSIHPPMVGTTVSIRRTHTEHMLTRAGPLPNQNPGWVPGRMYNACLSSASHMLSVVSAQATARQNRTTGKLAHICIYRHQAKHM